MELPERADPLETVLFEPDQQQVLAVLPGALWLAPGDIVELKDPPRDARVLSTRLQLRGSSARILVVLDVADDLEDSLRGDVPTEIALQAEVEEPVLITGDELDRDLEALETSVEGGTVP